MLRSTRVVVLLGVAVQIVAFLRTAIIAATLGTSPDVDAYNLGLIAPGFISTVVGAWLQNVADTPQVQIIRHFVLHAILMLGIELRRAAVLWNGVNVQSYFIARRPHRLEHTDEQGTSSPGHRGLLLASGGEAGAILYREPLSNLAEHESPRCLADCRL